MDRREFALSFYQSLYKIPLLDKKLDKKEQIKLAELIKEKLSSKYQFQFKYQKS
jgi:hypothetical protein